MLRNLIDIIPFWWMVLTCIGILSLTTIGAAFISSRVFSIPINHGHRELSNSLIGILSGGFSVLLAFVIINTWNYFLKAQENAAQEANSLAIMIRNIALFPEAPKKKIDQAIRDYTVAVRVDEWGSMRRGYESPKAAAALENLYTSLQSYNPQTSQEKIYYTQALENLNLVLKCRRARSDALHSVIPENLSSALLIGSFVLALILGLIRGDSRFVDLIPVILFSVVLGLNLAIALSFDFPFSGEIAVKNTYFYEGILGTFPD